MFDDAGKFLKEESRAFENIKIFEKKYTTAESGLGQKLYVTSNGGFLLSMKYGKGLSQKLLMNYYHPVNDTQWTYEQKKESKIKSLDVIDEYNKKLYILVSLNDKQLKLEGIDINNGQVVESFLPDNFEHPVVINNLIPHPSNPGLLILSGSYVEGSKPTLKETAKGLAFITIDTKGAIVKQQYLSFENELSKLLNVSSKGKFEDLGYLFVHNLLSHDGKNFYAIAEGYSRAFNLTGLLYSIASAGTNGSMTKVNIHDVVVLHMNENFELQNCHVINQKKRSFSFTGGTYQSINLLAREIKTSGGFNYSFSGNNHAKDKTQFYINGMLKKNGNVNWYFQIVSLKDNTMDKVDYPAYYTGEYNGGSLGYYIAEPGKILVFGYSKDEQKIILRIKSI